jgi:hypothetical protein
VTNPPRVKKYRWCSCETPTCLFRNPGLAAGRWPEWGGQLLDRFGSTRKIFHFGPEALKRKQAADQRMKKLRADKVCVRSLQTQTSPPTTSSSQGTPGFWDCACRRHVQPRAGHRHRERLAYGKVDEDIVQNNLLTFPANPRFQGQTGPTERFASSERSEAGPSHGPRGRSGQWDHGRYSRPRRGNAYRGYQPGTSTALYSQDEVNDAIATAIRNLPKR